MVKIWENDITNKLSHDTRRIFCIAYSVGHYRGVHRLRHYEEKPS